jgi:hypothetical protein
MNIGKLLAVGRSIVSGRNEVAYRTDKQFYLPKFGPAKNPFTKAPTEPAPVTPKKEQAATPVVSPVPAPAQPVARRMAPVEPAPVPRQAQPVFGKAPVVQPELSLDSVKVVHNDLSDAEVEVVPLKSRGGVAELPPAKKSWEILGERLLRSAAL